MRTSGPGSKGRGRRSRRGPAPDGDGSGNGSGFTLIELLIVIAIIAISIAVVSVSLRDAQASKLDEEGERLSALLEMARAEARVSGTEVRWVPTARAADDGSRFHFVGLGQSQPLPTGWLDPQTQAQIVGDSSVLLGPEAILPPQRIVLQLGEHRIEIASDGLAPFAIAPAQELAR